MHQTCTQCQSPFEITDADLAFYESVSPVFGEKRYTVPPPTLCPLCRFQRRLSFRHGRKLYNRKCDLSGKETISMYAADTPFKVYEQTEWWSDKWEGIDMGRDFDFNRPFFEQLWELFLAVPHISLVNINSENSYYTNHALSQKNCYLVFGATKNEDVYYGNFVNSCTSCMDSTSLTASELCYEGIASIDCYNCRFVMNCRNCQDCFMVEDCQGCKNCIGCFGLRNAEYYVFNQFVGKEKYEMYKKNLEQLDQTKILQLRQKFNDLKFKLPHLYAHIYNSEDCTGDFIFNSKNCHYAFDCKECQDCKFICFTPKSFHSYDCTFNAPDGVNYSYEVASTVGAKSLLFTYMAWYCSESLYSIECHNSQNLFGCVSLKKKEYCILNKQYTKEEYEKLVPRIIEHMQKTGEWGEYFPMSLSPFSYNESSAQDYFPLTEAEVRQRGLAWRTDDITNRYQGPTADMTQNIKDVSDDITKQILTCQHCSKNYKIIIQELRLYRDMKLPLPTMCPECRQKFRLALRNPRRLWNRSCSKCGTAFETTYAPERKEIVYCEKCYQETVY